MYVCTYLRRERAREKKCELIVGVTANPGLKL